MPGTADPIVLELRPDNRWIAPAAPAFRGEVPAAGVMLGLPCHGGLLTTATLRGLLDCQRTCLALGLPFTCLTISNESLVQRARNAIVAHFLASTHAQLLFIDADIGFGAAGVLRLLAQGRPVIGGLYRRKRLDRQDWVVHWQIREDGSARRDPRTGAVEVAAIGTGFLCIDRDALLRLIRAFPQTRYVPDADDGPDGPWRHQAYALFEAGIEPRTGRYLSEDYLFCGRWRSIGGEVWCDPGIRLEHHGQACFEGDAMEQFTPLR